MYAKGDVAAVGVALPSRKLSNVHANRRSVLWCQPLLSRLFLHALLCPIARFFVRSLPRPSALTCQCWRVRSPSRWVCSLVLLCSRTPSAAISAAYYALLPFFVWWGKKMSNSCWYSYIFMALHKQENERCFEKLVKLLLSWLLDVASRTLQSFFICPWLYLRHLILKHINGNMKTLKTESRKKMKSSIISLSIVTLCNSTIPWRDKVHIWFHLPAVFWNNSLDRNIQKEDWRWTAKDHQAYAIY